MADTTFKVNDWCVCDYKIQQITEIEEGRICGLSDGWTSTHGHSFNDRCFPLTRRNKTIVDCIQSYRDKLSALPQERTLSWPDIHRKLCDLFCDAINAEDVKDKPNAGLEKARLFYEEAREALQRLSGITIQGVSIVGRR